ncbi:hypothetical protein DSO57_1028594 [Entomophthora muscae]|uniref:Uncharacterized protein n=1 Tax=Entomophthora muscae TaxID=34485 RepID=A0ACC2TNY0_9FUNG|nr:hypothetical protein DSO57_1028594 [Entomophthora muscae]
MQAKYKLLTNHSSLLENDNSSKPVPGYSPGHTLGTGDQKPHRNPSLKKSHKEPKQADLTDKLTEVLQAFMATGKPVPNTITAYVSIVNLQNIKQRIALKNANTVRRTTLAVTASYAKIVLERLS